MSKVYFKRIENFNDTDTINEIVYNLIEKIIKENNIHLESSIPLKVHFGEKGNKTFVKPIYYNGIKKYLSEHNLETCYIETNVLYKGSRTYTKDHIETARTHGFDDLDIIIADSDDNNPYNEIEINLKHFNKCKIGKKYEDYKNFIVLSHFKGHGLAGFGGAIKQLGMGFASRGGKMHQHANSVPNINKSQCIKCGACIHKCPVNAIKMLKKADIDSKLCIGCASCTTICPVSAITNCWDSSHFHEKLAEYAYAAAKNKNNIYITYAFNITAECDCLGKEMSLISPNIGIFASTDPVAIDQACYDKLIEINKNEMFVTAQKTLDYAEKIKLGSKTYELIES